MDRKHNVQVSVLRDDFPALLRAAEQVAVSAQKAVLNQYRFYSAVLLGVALFGAFPSPPTWLSVILAVLLVISLIFSIYMFKSQSKEIWYRARALAESIKTSSWRYMTKTEPYSASVGDGESTKRFCSVLQQLLHEHPSLAANLGGQVISGDQVTAKMRFVRSLDLNDRVKVYLRERVDDQKNWYGRKAAENRRGAFRWFLAIWLLHVMAIISVGLEWGVIGWKVWPTDFLIVGSVAALAWVELKRFREQAEAYGLTEIEIGLLRSSFDHPTSEPDVSRLVDDAENAFSREHTQWLARRNIFRRV